jgi:Holliday junction resolvase RusA-like endonuclease
MTLSVWIPFLPPSSNNIYINHPQGHGRVLSSKARAFKVQAMREVQQSGRVAFLGLKQNVPYELRLDVFFDQIEYKKSEKGKRFKRIDLSNQIKLVEDTVAEATGIGDEHNFRLVLSKHCDPEHQGVYVTLSPIPEEEIGLTKEQFDAKEKERRAPGGSSVSAQPHRASRGMQEIRIPRSTSGDK